MIKIYKIVDIDLNKVIYVGQHNGTDLEDRMDQHRKDKTHPSKVDYLKTHNCKIELIMESSNNRARNNEQYYIYTLDTYEPKGFNRISAVSTATVKAKQLKEIEKIAKWQASMGLIKKDNKIKLDEYDRYIEPSGTTQRKWNSIF